MTIARTLIQEFSTANPLYAAAIVTAYTVANGKKTTVKQNLYASISGQTLIANPQTLDANGMFKQPVYIDDATILNITNIGNAPDHDTGIISAGHQDDVVISSAQILAMDVTPKQLIAAPGANKAIIFHRAVFFLNYNSIAYASVGGADDINLRYTDGGGPIVGTLETTGFLDQAASNYAVVTPAAGSVILAPNAPLVASLAGNVTTGNSPIAVRLYYDIVDLSTLLTA